MRMILRLVGSSSLSLAIVILLVAVVSPRAASANSLLPSTAIAVSNCNTQCLCQEYPVGSGNLACFGKGGVTGCYNACGCTLNGCLNF